MPVASGSIAFLGAARFQGYWNASTNTGTGSVYGGISGEKLGLFATGTSPNAGYEVTTGLTASKGDYWQVTGSGAHNVDGQTNWNLNDFCIFSGSTSGAGTWKKLAFEDTIASIIVGDLTSSSFHMGTASDGHVIFSSGSVFSGSSDFVYDYLSSKLSVTTVSGTTITPHTLNLGQGGLAGPAATVSSSAGTFATLSGSKLTSHVANALTLSGSALTVHNITLDDTSITADASEINRLDGASPLTLVNNKAVIYSPVSVITASGFWGYRHSGSEGKFATLSASSVTPHVVTLGPGGLAGPAATVSSSAGTFATLSGSAVTVHTLSAASISPVSVSASSGEFATLSGSEAQLHNITLNNVAITSDAADINLLDGAAAGTLASSKAVIYSADDVVTGSSFVGFRVATTEGVFTNSTLGVATGSSFTGFRTAGTEAIYTTVSGSNLSGHGLSVGPGFANFKGGGIILDNAGGGDAKIGFKVGSNHKWVIGDDASDSHKFKIGYNTVGADIANSEEFELDSSGNLVLLGNVSTAAGTVSGSAGTFATLSGSTVTAHALSAASVSSTTVSATTVTASAMLAHSGNFSEIFIKASPAGGGRINFFDTNAYISGNSNGTYVYNEDGSVYIWGTNGVRIPDDIKLYLGSSSDSYLMYDEAGQDIMTISGSKAGGIVLSGSKLMLDVNGSPHIVASGSRGGPGSYLALASNGQVVLSTPDAGTGTVTALNNQAESRLVTIGSTTTELDGEANLTFNGTTLTLAGVMTGSSYSGFAGNFTELGNTTTNFLTASEGAKFADDKKVYFGDSQESHIRYDEAGQDFLTISGSHAGGIVLSGSKLMLDINGAPDIVASGSRGGPGSFLALATNGQVVLATPDGGGGGAVSSVSNGADNRIATFSDSDSLNGEANLTFNGSALTLAGTMTGSSYSGFNVTTTEGVFTNSTVGVATGSSFTGFRAAATEGAFTTITGSSLAAFNSTATEVVGTTVSASSANFATLSGSAVSAHTLAVNTFAPAAVSASSGQFATLSGSTATVNSLSLGNTAITSDAGEINLLDGASAGALASSKAVIYSSTDVVTGSAFVGFRATVSELGNTVANQLTASQGAKVADDMPLYFGTDQDSLIRYDETGQDFLTISGSSAGTVLSGSVVRVVDKLSVGGDMNSTKASGILMVNAAAADTTNGLIATFKSGDSDYCRVNIDNTTANGDTQFTFMSNGSSKWSVGNMGSNETFHIKSGFGDFADSDPFVLTTSGLTINTTVSASSYSGFRIAATEGAFGSSTLGIATGSSFTGFRSATSEAVSTTLSASATTVDNIGFQKATSNSSQTTGMVVAITGSNLTYGSALHVYSSGSGVEPTRLVKIQNQHLLATASACLQVIQESKGLATVIRGKQVRNVGDFGFAQVTNGSGQTISAENLVDGIYFAMGRGGSQSDTTATAADIVYAIGHPYEVKVLDTVTFRYYNASSNTVTLQGGTNVLNSFALATASFSIAANSGRVFAISVYSNHPASPKVTVTPLSDTFSITS